MTDDPSSTCWRLHDHRVDLSCGGFAATFDLQRPHLGLHDMRLRDAHLSGSLMALNAQSPCASVNDQPPLWEPADPYVRTADLVVTYREPFGQRFNLQLYLRLLAAAQDRIELEAILSIETREWEAYPALSLTTTLANAIATMENNAVVYALDNHHSYVETALPEDFAPQQAGPLAAAGESATWRYGKQFMERGVMRRLRLRGAILPRAAAPQAAERMLAALRQEEPPLTA